MRAAVLCVVCLAYARPARAGASVGVIVTGEPSLQAPITAVISDWLQQHGRGVAAAPLPAQNVTGFIDCFVLGDMACARRIVDEHATSDAIVFARVEVAGGAAARNVTISAYWVGKGHEVTTQRTECKSCSEDALKITAEAMMFSLDASAAAAQASATPGGDGASAPMPEATAVTATATPPSAAHRGLAIGAELGEPTSATVAWFHDAIVVTGALGTGTREGVGLSFHADAQVVVTRIRPELAVRIGLGGRVYHHGYQAMSIDELPDTHYGIRASAALALARGPLELYAEAGPGIDLARSRSCTLGSGPSSICPHAQSTPFFLQLVVGARWFLSR